MHNEQLVENIKKLAKEKNTSVKSVLETCNINRNFMYDIKKGSTPSSDVLLRLADYFNVTMDYLLGLTNEINIHPHSGWYFIFGHSTNRYWQRTSASFIGLPAMHLLLTTRKRVPWVEDT